MEPAKDPHRQARARWRTSVTGSESPPRDRDVRLAVLTIARSPFCSALVAVAIIAAVRSGAASAGRNGAWDWPRPLGANHGFPKAADESRERVVRFRNAHLVKVRVAPAVGGVICFIMHWPDGSGSDGCPHDTVTRRGSVPRLMQWHGARLLFGAVPPGTTRAVVHFQDGSVRTLTPRARLIAVTIQKPNYAPEHRPANVQLRTNDRVGKPIKLGPVALFG